jgi:hypothetical protein
MARKPEKGPKSQEFSVKGLEGLRRSSTKAGNGDESSTSPLTNNGDTNRDGDGNEDENTIEESEYRNHWYKDVRRTCGKIVNNSRFQFVMVACIVVNALMMGIATYFPEEGGTTLQTDLSEAFDLADNIFLVIFTLELIIQFIYHGWKLFFDGWLLFDFVIIMISWFAFISRAAGAGIGTQFQVFRAFRIFRALRLITRVKIMKDLIIGKRQIVTQLAVDSLLGFRSSTTCGSHFCSMLSNSPPCAYIHFSSLSIERIFVLLKQTCRCSDGRGDASNGGYPFDVVAYFLHLRRHVYAALLGGHMDRGCA